MRLNDILLTTPLHHPLAGGDSGTSWIIPAVIVIGLLIGLVFALRGQGS